jgi:hypothetical protein
MVAGGPGGSGSTSIAREVPVVVAATEKATETRIAEEAMAVKMTKESAVVMAAEEAIAKVVADAVVMNTVDQGATVGKTTVGSPGSSSSSPPPGGGIQESGITPPSMRICCAWKPWYAKQLYSHPLLFIYLCCI